MPTDGLQDLIHTVQAGKADVRVILVYDISRWGRFPDMDEAATSSCAMDHDRDSKSR